MSRGGRATGWEENVALALGVGRIGWINNRVSDSGVRGILTIPCSRGHGVEVEMPTKFPHDVIKKKLQRQGWAFHGSKPVCPACIEADQKKGKRPPPKLIVVPQADPIAQDTAPASPQPAQQEKETNMPADARTLSETSTMAIGVGSEAAASAKAKAARRQVIQWLEEAFDITGPDQGRYRAGTSDASIAKETGCSEKAVAEIREEFFGKLAKPKEMDTILSEAKVLREAAERLESEAKATAESLRKRATEIENKLQRFAEAQGWA